jgi:hypothetical protein
MAATIMSEHLARQRLEWRTDGAHHTAPHRLRRSTSVLAGKNAATGSWFAHLALRDI